MEAVLGVPQRRWNWLSENGNNKLLNYITLTAVILGTLISIFTILASQATTNQRMQDYIEFQKDQAKEMKSAIDLQNTKIEQLRIEQAKQNQKFDDLQIGRRNNYGSTK